jgi:hypothetical protein
MSLAVKACAIARPIRRGSKHWREASSYVALSRHSRQASIFAAHDTAENIDELAEQMAREERKFAASHYRTAEKQRERQQEKEHAKQRETEHEKQEKHEKQNAQERQADVADPTGRP